MIKFQNYYVSKNVLLKTLVNVFYNIWILRILNYPINLA